MLSGFDRAAPEAELLLAGDVLVARHQHYPRDGFEHV